MRFKLYLSNWTPDRFEIRSVATTKVAIMIPGLYLIFQKCGMCQVFAQQVTYFVVRLPLAFHSYIQEKPEAVMENALLPPRMLVHATC